MNYRIVHRTVYRYAESASLSQNELYLHPRETACQRLMDSRLDIDPQPQYVRRHVDYFGNVAHVFMVQQPHEALTTTASSRVATWPPAVLDADRTAPWEHAARRLAAHVRSDELAAFQFVFPSPLIRPGQRIKRYAQAAFPPGRPVLAGALDLIQRIFNDFAYDPSATTVDSPVDQVLIDRKGVCQDFAHLAIGGLRSLGLAARYVSGYLETQPPPGQTKLIGADASHAWLSLFVPDAGWVDLDPTNNLIPGERHVTLAWGRDYGDVTPVKGVVMGGGSHTLSVMVDVIAQR